MYEDELKKAVREIPDFPKPGILFYDLSTLFLNKRAFPLAIDILAHRYLNIIKIDKILSIEARGFVLGSALAYRLSCGVIMARKKGKLPYKTASSSYSLEYGIDEIHMHIDAISKGDRILVVDDLLATGGTAGAAVELINQFDGEVVECAFLVELVGLGGREKLKHTKVHSVLKYEVDE